MSLLTGAGGVTACAVAVVACDLMERAFARGMTAADAPKQVGSPGHVELAGPIWSPGLQVLRWAAYVVLLVFWLALAGRVAFAATATIITGAILLVVSREKYHYLKEPFVLTDFTFLFHVMRHPDLFYVSWFKAFVIFGIFGGILGLITGWMLIEPRSLSWADQGLLALALLAVGWIAYKAPRLLLHLWPRAFELVVSAPAVRFVSDLGLLASLMVTAVAFGVLPTPAPSRRNPAADDVVPDAAREAVVVVQSESFCDLRRQGAALSLPSFDLLKARAVARGRLAVPCYGAYTLRPEFALSTGLGFSALGLDRFHPYLRASRFSAHALPARLAAAGWETVFLHPYDPHFFGRAQAVPQLGFGRFLSLADFDGAARCGPYVADAELAARMRAELEAARAAGRPLYMMAVTMEAHDPYGIGRLPDTDDPLEQYAAHLAHADALLASLVAALDASTERALLVFYGDHAPLLPGFGMLAEDPRTDYIVIECGRAAARPALAVAESERAPEDLHALVRRWLSGRDPV